MSDILESIIVDVDEVMLCLLLVKLTLTLISQPFLPLNLSPGRKGLAWVSNSKSLRQHPSKWCQSRLEIPLLFIYLTIAKGSVFQILRPLSSPEHIRASGTSLLSTKESGAMSSCTPRPSLKIDNTFKNVKATSYIWLQPLRD